MEQMPDRLGFPGGGNLDGGTNRIVSDSATSMRNWQRGGDGCRSGGWQDTGETVMGARSAGRWSQRMGGEIGGGGGRDDLGGSGGLQRRWRMGKISSPTVRLRWPVTRRREDARESSRSEEGGGDSLGGVSAAGIYATESSRGRGIGGIAHKWRRG
uniref:Uncharacterized protein n=1 Tax=Oryza meridionalis TaxID=40149 RepID=A0A0E0CFJ5_9ORYZ